MRRRGRQCCGTASLHSLAWPGLAWQARSTSHLPRPTFHHRAFPSLAPRPRRPKSPVPPPTRLDRPTTASFRPSPSLLFLLSSSSSSSSSSPSSPTPSNSHPSPPSSSSPFFFLLQTDRQTPLLGKIKDTSQIQLRLDPCRIP
ncbi:hypothetical protein LZ32DRAFT_332602 [Colletotrichum eremochloae]|nr:hypothetical protein LZ32DRAFT_332602 [Colletotrichum eremochloae]